MATAGYSGRSLPARPQGSIARLQRQGSAGTDRCRLESRGIDLVHDLQKNHLDDEKNPFHHMTVQQQKEAELPSVARGHSHASRRYPRRKGHAPRGLSLRPVTSTATTVCRWRCGRALKSSASTATASATMGATRCTGGPASYTSSPDGKWTGSDRLADAEGQATLREAWQQDLPEFDGRGEPELGSRTDQRHDRPGERSLQSEVGDRQRRAPSRAAESNKIVWGKVP